MTPGLTTTCEGGIKRSQLSISQNGSKEIETSAKPFHQRGNGSSALRRGDYHRIPPRGGLPCFPSIFGCVYTFIIYTVDSQYSNYSIADSTVDGNLTLGENLADHGGLTMALAAYTQWRQDHVDHR